MNEIEEYLQELNAYQPYAKRVFLSGANPFALSFDKLQEIALKIKYYLPKVQSIGCFSRVTDITPKTTEQLEKLHDLGYNAIIIGTETGYDDTLDFMNKGYQADELVEQLSRLDRVGITYHISYLNGLAGAGKSQTAALESAKIYNQINPISLSIVLDDLKRVTHYARQEEQLFAEHITRKNSMEARREMTQVQREIDTYTRRNRELITLFKRLMRTTPWVEFQMNIFVCCLLSTPPSMPHFRKDFQSWRSVWSISEAL